MNTQFLLLAQYGGAAFIPLSTVCRDFFQHLTPERLWRKVKDGEIDLTVVAIDESQKTTRGVHLSDLAEYLDRQRAEAIRNKV